MYRYTNGLITERVDFNGSVVLDYIIIVIFCMDIHLCLLKSRICMWWLLNDMTISWQKCVVMQQLLFAKLYTWPLTFLAYSIYLVLCCFICLMLCIIIPVLSSTVGDFYFIFHDIFSHWSDHTGFSCVTTRIFCNDISNY